MQVKKASKTVKCDVGGCKNTAAYTVVMRDKGIKSTLNLCARCLGELSSALLSCTVPKSIETAKPKKGESK